MQRRSAYRVIAALGVLGGLALTTGAVVTGRLFELVLDGDYLPYVTFALAGLFAYSRRPDHPIARRLLGAGSGLLLALTIGRLASYVAETTDASGWFWIANTLEQIVELAALATLVSLFAMFPEGQYERAYERHAVQLAWLLVALVPAIELVALPTMHVNDNFFTFEPVAPSPIFMPGFTGLGGLGVAAFDGRIALIPLAALLLALRYRRLPPERRAQAKWPLLAVLAFGIVGVGPVRGLIELATQWNALPPVAGTIAYQVTNALVPLALVLGLLRYRLLDLELVVRKSLVYGVLWLAIALVYVAPSAAFGLAVGDRLPVGVAVGCTIVAALAFQPARAWLEGLADRWVFGERMSGYTLLSQFGAALEQAVDPSDLATRLASTVRRGLRVRWVRVVLGNHVTADGITADALPVAALAAPLVHDAEAIGAIECGPRVDGGLFGVQDEQLLVTLGRQATLALRNSHLTTALEEELERTQHQARELAASRTRIVHAEDAARQRIERDLHDGVQQELVAILAKLGLARNRLSRNGASAVPLLLELQDDAKQVIQDLRELVHGIHSPVLSDRGLVEAVEARVARLPLSVVVETDGLARGTRVAQEIETAAYFVVCEGLTNTLKHGTAHQASVRLALCPGELVVDVSDDGRGIDLSRARWSGLQGLTDRVEALGGRFEVANMPPGTGTRVTARLPIHEATADA